jgi:tetratricopeptide (TPR) repeat protein
MRAVLCKTFPLLLPLVPICAILVVASANISNAQNATSKVDPAVQQELDYAEWLNRQGLPDYAEMVLKRLNVSESGSQMKVLQLEGLLSRGKFDDARKVIAAQPNQDSQDVWAMKTAMANYYYMWGKYTNAQAIYSDFFKRYSSGPPESMTQFYVESGYNYQQLLVMTGKEREAVEVFQNILKAKLEKALRRRVLCEMGDLMVRTAEKYPSEKASYLPEVKKIFNEILWQQDLWFGKAIVLMAHVKMMENDIDGAMKLIDGYKPQLDEIDKSLKNQEAETHEQLTRLSPMAECRYLMGVIMQTEAEKLIAAGGDKEKIVTLLAGKKLAGGKRSAGALQNFLIVFVDYSTTSWAPDAAARAKKVEEILKNKYGAAITTNITPDKLEAVRKAQFMQARVFFNQQQFADSADAYLAILNLFPEGESCIAALTDLAQCYIELKDELYSEMVIRYMGERFGQNPDLMAKAGDEVIRLAELFANEPAKRDKIYDVFFKNFTRHPRAAVSLYRFGELRFGTKDYDEALGYYKDIEQNYTNSPLYLGALSKIAFCYSEMSNTVAETKTLETYVDKLTKKDKPGQALASATFRLAYAYRQMGDKFLPKAVNKFTELIKMLSDPNNPYQNSPEEKEANARILESAMFHRAIGLAMLTQPEDKVKDFKMQAIRSFSELATKFPKSQYAPKALSRAGTLWTVLKNPAEAKKIFDKLQKNYPDSPDAKLAAYMMGRTFLELGMHNEAVAAFKDMFSNKEGKYSAGQILQAGNELLKFGEYEIALDAFTQALNSPSLEKNMREPALTGQGKSLVELGKYEDGAKILEQLLKEFPKSGYTIEACQSLSRAYAEMAMKEKDELKRYNLFQTSVKTMKQARKLEKSVAGGLKLGLGVAKIYILESKAETEPGGSAEKARAHLNDAIAVYHTITLTGTDEKEAKAYIETAFIEYIPLLLETDRWQDTVEACDEFLAEFPSSKRQNDVRSWRNSATTKLVTEGKTPAQTETAVREKPAASTAEQPVEGEKK